MGYEIQFNSAKLLNIYWCQALYHVVKGQRWTSAPFQYSQSSKQIIALHMLISKTATHAPQQPGCAGQAEKLGWRTPGKCLVCFWNLGVSPERLEGPDLKATSSRPILAMEDGHPSLLLGGCVLRLGRETGLSFWDPEDEGCLICTCEKMQPGEGREQSRRRTNRI